MKAAVLKEYGGPEALDVIDLPDPEAGGGQVIVRQHATTFNPIDMKLASGAQKAGKPLTFPFVPGGDVAGVVEAIGADVDDLRVGDEVFGYSASGGAYAELIAISADAVAHKPLSIPFIDAAALALVGQTASQALEATGLAAGDTLVIIGAGGPVGSATVQIASGMGIKVIGVAGNRDTERLRAIGASKTLERGYAPEQAPTGADAVIDTVGGEGQIGALAMLREGGTLVALNQPPSQEEAERRRVRAVLVLTKTSRASLDQLRERMEAGTLRPFVAQRYRLADAAALWRHALDRTSSGKRVLEMIRD
ncbi:MULTISPECIES: NADP-dependent oxidoreductase [unclassified Sphingomonas]|uniref:NADP-dependent oxidoreductase n=1 Tax=unclassified Sphingomonas TaxID=196159 RepID=UPI002269C331|nr:MULTISPECIES: NADP-dependent oxidoreductase [unclassified Sphingomonas]